MAVSSRPSNWHPASWRDFEALQLPEWPDESVAEGVYARLRGLPPLVFAGEARRLTRALAQVEAGKAFVLQAGRELKILHKNLLAERTLASPAIAGGRIFLRTDEHLIAIGAPALSAAAE